LKLLIEDWLESQQLDQESSSNFTESFVCFKVGAYKAALLFAYLGFMGVVRARISSANAPAGLTAAEWATIQNNVRSAETWDKAVFTAIQKKQTHPIFLVADDLRHQTAYWKDRRNDCAHSKANKIVAAHVEAFYAFLESNLSKFVVNGSRPATVARILNFYNPSITPPGLPIAPIIQDVPHAVAVNELDAFLTELAVEFDNRRNAVEQALNQESKQKQAFLSGVFQFGTDDLKDAGSRHLAAHAVVAVAFLRAYPQHAPALGGFPANIRQLWHDFLFTTSNDDFPLFATLLRTGLIPQAEVQEAVRRIVSRSHSSVPTGLDEDTLRQSGFFDEIERGIVVDDKLADFAWAQCGKVTNHQAPRRPSYISKPGAEDLRTLRLAALSVASAE